MDCSTPGFPVLHQLPELAQTHVHWVGDAIQPSHPLSSPSSPIFNLSQHQGLFQGVSSSHQVAKVLASASTSVLPMNIEDWFPLGLLLVKSRYQILKKVSLGCSQIVPFVTSYSHREAWRAAVHGVAKSQTQLKWLNMHAQSWINMKNNSRYWWGGRVLRNSLHKWYSQF